MISKHLPLRVLASLVFAIPVTPQVYSPSLLRRGQPDPADLQKFAAGIYSQAGAHTARERAEAIWRFFLTDGRFVKPGFWYHIAGWTYEEPAGEVLDPMKLLNSYGFGLCYHIAPLLEAVFEAGGFADARCWFLTGHTVAEVFYDGSYHYFDADMMGYNVAGGGSFRGKRIASVRDVERDGNIILDKLLPSGKVKPQVVDSPWYPADVNAKAMGDLAQLFTTADDNHLYPYARYSLGHSMHFMLRRGETMTRYFAPEKPDLFYLPYKFDGKHWTEFPQEFDQYHIRTVDGPRSQKDGRMWATGKIEYKPLTIPDRRVILIDMPSPYVIIDAGFTIDAQLPDSASLRVETSTDAGLNWTAAGELKGPHRGEWTTEPKLLVRSAHGRLTAVSGSYAYQVRLTKLGAPVAHINSLRLLSRIQLNPRTLPAIEAGANEFVYSASSSVVRIAIPAPLAESSNRDFELVNENGQPFLLPRRGKTGYVVYVVEADGRELKGFDAGARFLDLYNGLAPDKLTAETRHVGVTSISGDASVEWSISPEGPFRSLWQYPETLHWRDGDQIGRLLLWPEVFRHVGDLPAGTKRIYVRFRSSGPGLDNIRLAAYAEEPSPTGVTKLTQVWRENGTHREHTERFDPSTRDLTFAIEAGPNVRNEAVILAAE